MDHFISMYIDNELSLDEKILFIKQVHSSKPYKEDAVALIEQEKLLQAALHREAPPMQLNPCRSDLIPSWTRQIGWAIAACLLVVLTFMVKDNFAPGPDKLPDGQQAAIIHRFVIQHPNSDQIEITGSFTNWQSIPLVPTGSHGYWEVYLDVPPGEHRYSFIIDGSKFLPDPTVPVQEVDDFGSTNSILTVGV